MKFCIKACKVHPSINLKEHLHENNLNFTGKKRKNVADQYCNDNNNTDKDNNNDDDSVQCFPLCVFKTNSNKNSTKCVLNSLQ